MISGFKKTTFVYYVISFGYDIFASVIWISKFLNGFEILNEIEKYNNTLIYMFSS